MTTPGGSATLTGGFTYVAAPSVISISPSSGPTIGGTSVTINGTGFVSGNTTVTIGGVSAAAMRRFIQLNYHCYHPPGISGPQDVTVTTPGGSVTLTGGFTYMAAPTIGSISPSSGPTTGGTLITITGTNFCSGNTTVTIDGVPATGVAVSSNSTITATIPAGTVGAQNVVITTPGGSATLTGGFTYVARGRRRWSRWVGGSGGGSVIDLNVQGFASTEPLKIAGKAFCRKPPKSRPPMVSLPSSLLKARNY